MATKAPTKSTSKSPAAPKRAAKKTAPAERAPKPAKPAKPVKAAVDNRRDGVGYWLVKIESDVYPWKRLAADGNTVWDGVRNYTARNNLRAMKLGDQVLYYHSGEDKAVTGVARVTREAFKDASAPDEDWSAVELAPLAPLDKSVSLAEMKKSAAMEGLAMFKQAQLSVMPVTPVQFDEVLRLGKTTLPKS